MLKKDEHALKLLLEEYHNYLVVVGLRYLRDRQRVEDVIQDLFADLWNKGENVEIKCSVKSYLRGSVINKCLAIIRKESRIELVEEQDHNLESNSIPPDQLMDRDNLQMAIDEIVSELPDKCRQVFLLSRNEGKSHAEIAEKLGISKKTIENHISKALRELRMKLTRKELLILFIILKKIVENIGGNT